MNSAYEFHRHPNPLFPVILKQDVAGGDVQTSYLHWHESIELLYCIEGAGTVVSDAARIPFQKGDIAVINSGCIHTVYTQDTCKYYYLIADTLMLAEVSFPGGEDVYLKSLVQDATAARLFEAMIDEMRRQDDYYQMAVRAGVLQLYVHLYRHHMDVAPVRRQKGKGATAIVREATAFIRKHYTQEITPEDICTHIGCSKNYLCRSFKQVTRQTVMGYIHFLRRSKAGSLMPYVQSIPRKNARPNDLNNLSYFIKNNQEAAGELPMIRSVFFHDGFAASPDSAVPSPEDAALHALELIVDVDDALLPSTEHGTLQKGQMILREPGAQRQPSRGYQAFAVHFELPDERTSWKRPDLRDTAGNAAPHILETNQYAMAKSHFKALYAACESQQMHTLTAKAHLMALLACFTESGRHCAKDLRQGNIPRASYEKVLRAKRYIDEHLHVELRLEDIAQSADLSVSYLCRVFKQLLKETPVEYSNRVRIERAKQLLCETDLPLKGIVAQCGFNNYTYFCTLFKKLEGETPTSFKNSFRHVHWDAM